MKKRYLKQLTISDVMVAMIRQEQIQDRTQQLKEYLYKTTTTIHKEDREAEQIIILPQFAEKIMTEQQLLIYHIDKNNWAGDQYLNYENLLESINGKRKKIIDESSTLIHGSQTIISELIEKTKQFYNFIKIEREPLHNLAEHINSKYLKIKKKIAQTKNMKSALDIMNIWNKSNISKVLRIKTENVLSYREIDEIFMNFHQIIQFLNQNKKQMNSYNNLIVLIQDRRRNVITKIYDNMYKSIINYTNQEQYKIKYKQYDYILKNQLIDLIVEKKVIKQCIFKEQILVSLLEKNIHEIYAQIFSKNGAGMNIDMLNEDKYVDFFNQLMEQYSLYFSSWHKITTYHIHNETLYKEGFIKYRTVVYQKALDRLSQSLKYSNKFTFIGLKRQLELFEKIKDFMMCGEQWMGKCKSNISQVLLQKYRCQIQTFFKMNNGDLKSTLFEQFSINQIIQENAKEDNKYIQENNKIKIKLSLQDQMESIVNNFSKFDVNTDKLQHLFFEKKVIQGKINEKNSFLTKEDLQVQIKMFYNKLTTKLGFKFFKNIVQYQLRQHYLPDNTQLFLIYQHIQFIIIILYKVCIPNNMKRQIQKQIFNQTQKMNRTNNIKMSLNKGVVDENVISSLNELRHIFKERALFGDLYDFLCSIGNKYDGISVATYINPSIYFMDYERYEVQISQLNTKLLTVMNELFIIVEYLQYLINLNRFYKSPEAVYKKIIHFKSIIPSIVMVYFTTYFETSAQKYYKKILPLFSQLKFDIKKLANDTTVYFKDYKAKIIQIYRQTNVIKYSQHTCFNNMLFNKQTEYFYKFLIDLYSKIQKINDNGRTILSQQPAQFIRIVGIDTSYNGGDNWLNLLIGYIEISKERNDKAILERASKLVLQFPLQWWKSNIIWVYNDFTSKERAEYMNKLALIYYNKIISLPKI